MRKDENWRSLPFSNPRLSLEPRVLSVVLYSFCRAYTILASRNTASLECDRSLMILASHFRHAEESYLSKSFVILFLSLLGLRLPTNSDRILSRFFINWTSRFRSAYFVLARKPSSTKLGNPLFIQQKDMSPFYKWQLVFS